jgi:hypothetical protein
MAVTDSDGVAAPAWMTRTELAQASGLREDLIARFIPAASTPAGLMYAASQLAEAVYIKELTDQNLHPAAIENKVHEFRRRHLPAPTPAPIHSQTGSQSARTGRDRRNRRRSTTPRRSNRQHHRFQQQGQRTCRCCTNGDRGSPCATIQPANPRGPGSRLRRMGPNC